MKIGELSKRSKTPIDTIRYYVSLGLLNPKRKKSQYDFDKEDLDNILYIKSLKSMCFSLKEIERMIRFRCISNGVEPKILQDSVQIFQQKKEALIQGQQKLQVSIEQLTAEIEKISHRKSLAQEETGIPLRALELLTCPRCGKSLRAERASFANKYVKEGLLLCSCGYCAQIKHGIICTGNLYTGTHDKPDVGRELYSTLCDELLKMYQQSSLYIFQALQSYNLSGKVVLEGNINGYFFLYNHFQHLPKDCIYIVVDKYEQTVLMYKDFIEKLNLNLDILYIADAGNDLPIRQGCVDVLIDFYSSNEWQFYHQDSFVHAMLPFLNENCRIAGSYMSLPFSAVTRQNIARKYPECSEQVYQFGPLQKMLEAEFFHVNSEAGGIVKKTQNKFSFACHVDNENILFNLYTALRRERSTPAQNK